MIEPDMLKYYFFFIMGILNKIFDGTLSGDINAGCIRGFGFVDRQAGMKS